MVMGAPVSTTLVPLTRPSVPSVLGGANQRQNRTGLSEKRLLTHGNTSDGVFTQVLRDLEDQSVLGALDLESVQDGGELLGVELAGAGAGFSRGYKA